MKIAEIILDLRARAGAEVFFSGLCKNLLNSPSGNELLIISLYDEVDPSFDFLRNLPHSTFVTLSKKKGVDLKAAKKLKHLLSEFQPDIIHSHRSVLMTYFLAFGFSRKKWKLVHTVHNIANKESNRVTDILRKVYIRKGMLTLVGISNLISESIEEEKGISKAHIATIYNGAEFDQMSKIVPEKEFDFICVARFSAVKNHKMLLMAFNDIIKSGRKSSLLLLGKGDLLEECKRYAIDYGIDKYICFAGSVQNVFPYMQKSKVFILTSLYEGNPISILEALACGLPILCSRVGGIPDVVTEGENGWLFEPGDIEHLKSIMTDIVDGKPDLATIGCNNAKKSLLYTMRNCADQHMELFNDILNVREA